MAERKKLEVTILPQNFTETQQEQARKNISAAAISATVSKIESSDDTVSAIPYTAEDGSIRYDLKVSAAPVISETEIYGTNGISAKNQGVKWTIGLSADYLSGNALDNLSGNWQNTYNTVTNNSGKWNEVSSKLDTTAFSTVSGQFAIKAKVQEEFEQTSAWAIDIFQPKGDYLSANEKYLSANALNDLSGNWNSVYNTVDTNSANWSKGYNWIFDNSANIINASATLETNSGNWNSVYNTVGTNSGNWENSYIALTSTSATWNNHSALSASKLDKSAFEGWSANADVTEYSGVSPISINEHKVSIDLSEYYKKTETSGKEELNDRFEPIEADLDILKENSAHNVIESKNDYIKVYSGTNEFELEFISGDLATKTWVKEQLGDFGGFVVVNELPSTGDPKKIYLIKDSTVTGVDTSREWIITGAEPNTGWYCIGDTSIDLAPYVKISDISAASATWDSAYDWTIANSAKTMEVNSIVDTYSADWNNHSALSAVVDTKLDAAESAKFMFLSAIQGNAEGKIIGYGTSAIYHPTYYGKDGIAVEDYMISISADYLSANALDQLSGNWNSVYDTVETNSANWNEASAFNTNSGKFVTSGDEIADTDLAYVLKKTGDNVAWSGIDLSDLGKIYPITSITPDLVSATISAVNDIPTYVLSAKETDPVVYYDVSAKYAKAQSGIYNDKDYYFISGAEIIGNNGVSAEYDPVTNSWEVGLEEQTYTYAEAQTLLTTLTASTEALSGYTNIVKYGNGIDIDSTDITLDTGLYHVDIQVNIPVETVSNNTYSVSLTSNLSNAIVTHDIDASYIHTETFDLSFDVNALQNSNDLVFSISGLPVGYKYIVKNLQIHQVVTTDTILDVAGHIYGAGSGVLIDNQYNINVNYDETSGIGLNENNQLVVKLGKGLKFEESGKVAGTLTLDNITEEVVETVTELQAELNGKLTTNFPYPMITDNNTDFANYKGNGDNCICQLFSVSLNHKITTDTYFTVYMKDNGYSQANVIFGIFEYNFDYWDETAQRWRGQTNWVCDTGPVNLNKPTKDYKLEFPVTHINSAHDVLRSDRAYYAVLALKSDGGNGVFLACTDNYNGDVHSEPTLNWRWQSVPNLDFINASGTLENTYWWDPNVNNYDEKADMRRFFLQIRNKVQPTSTPNP